ncbi:MAG: hypothetical protein NTX52_13410 [Planctomycetota bacterium]|nr:hypothetical protein [Planctomycetota bacterium]
MNNQNVKLTEPIKTQVQTSLKKANQKSGSRVEKKTRQSRRLALRFSPTAWAKLLYFRDKTDNEVGGFGVTEPDDLLFVKEFVTVKQEVTGITVKFDDTAVADFFDTQVDLKRRPEQFARIWLHTHPGNSPEPSTVDEETFVRVFGNCQWAVMFVLAQDNRTYAKLSFNVGPGGQVLIPAEIDYGCDFGPSNQDLWDAEYQANIKAGYWLGEYDKKDQIHSVKSDVTGYALPYDFINELEKMEPAERQLILDELADRPDLWDEESEAMYL